MKTCTNCGRENEDARTHCSECGLELPAPATRPPPLPVPAVTVASPAHAPAASQADGPTKTSGFAIGSLILGVLGFLFVTALISIICGIIAVVRIDQSRGRLKGKGLAIVGMCLSALFIVTLPGLMLPALAKAKARAQRINCVSNLRQLALGIRMYATDHDDRYPAGDQWCDAITPYGIKPSVFHCPAGDGSARCTYALNSRLAGISEANINPRTVMLFEIQDGCNRTGGLAQMLARNPHPGGYNVALADGTVHQVPASQVSQLRWDP